MVWHLVGSEHTSAGGSIVDGDTDKESGYRQADFMPWLGHRRRRRDADLGGPEQTSADSAVVNGDWKVVFTNGTIITGVGKTPMVWHLVGSEHTSAGGSIVDGDTDKEIGYRQADFMPWLGHRRRRRDAELGGPEQTSADSAVVN